MKKVFIIVFGVLTLAGCNMDNEILPSTQQVTPELQITNKVGIKVSNPFVTNEVSMNVKSDFAGKAVIKITDIANRVVSKEEVEVNVGDNILKIYTTALPSSAYRIALFDVKGVQLGITDFNKIN
jgi:hypothetical protein